MGTNVLVENDVVAASPTSTKHSHEKCSTSDNGGVFLFLSFLFSLCFVDHRCWLIRATPFFLYFILSVLPGWR